MRRAERLDALMPKISALFGRGTVTNCLLSREELQEEIENGSLFFQEAAGVLLLFRRREGFYRMNFYLGAGAQALALPQERIVTEIAFRARDTALQEAAEQWKATGLTTLCTRRRLSLRLADAVPAQRTPEGITLGHAQAEDVSETLRLLCESFSPLTGCLPTRQELLQDILRGDVLLARAGNRLAGVLHLQGGTIGQIRHLATASALRGRGVASALLQCVIAESEARAMRVWAVCGNTAAERLYASFGFTDDGFQSVVLGKQ